MSKLVVVAVDCGCASGSRGSSSSSSSDINCSNIRRDRSDARLAASNQSDGRLIRSNESNQSEGVVEQINQMTLPPDRVYGYNRINQIALTFDRIPTDGLCIRRNQWTQWNGSRTNLVTVPSDLIFRSN